MSWYKFRGITGHDSGSILNINQQVSAVVAGPRAPLDVTQFLLEHPQTSWPTMWRRILTCVTKM